MAVTQDASPRVGEIMTRDVVVVGADDSLQDVARLMARHRVSGFPVVQGGRVVGVISEGDLVRRFRALRVPLFVDVLGGVFPLGSLAEVERTLREIASVKVSDLMSRPAVTARPEWTLQRASEEMVRRRINRLPVVDEEGRLVGIVTRVDLVRTMAGAAEGGSP